MAGPSLDKEGPQGPERTTPVQAFLGNTALRINQATMNLAIQQFLDREIVNPPKVDSVEWIGNLGWFEVRLSEKK
jgi:hypothetical protein